MMKEADLQKLMIYLIFFNVKLTILVIHNSPLIFTHFSNVQNIGVISQDISFLA